MSQWIEELRANQFFSDGLQGIRVRVLVRGQPHPARIFIEARPINPTPTYTVRAVRRGASTFLKPRDKCQELSQDLDFS